MVFNRDSVARKHFDFPVADGKACPLFGRHIDSLNRVVNVLLLRVAYLNQFRPETAPDNGGLALLQGRLGHIKFIRIDNTLNNRFTQTIRSRNKHNLVKSRFGIQRKNDTGCANITAYHALNSGRQGHIHMRKPLMYPVGNGTITIQ